jgi:cyanophycinase
MPGRSHNHLSRETQQRSSLQLPGGSLIIIGGREDRDKDMEILSNFCKRVGKNGKLVVATVASSVGNELWEIYRKAFRKLGVKSVRHLDVVKRTAAIDKAALRVVKGADAVFFTGGDQLRITSELGGTAVLDEIFEIYRRGGVIGGTSAGASVMSETMLVGGTSEESYRIGSELRMAPGLGLVKNMIIDQHFAERGRINRLIGAVAQNPKFLGIGIDEDTAIVMDGRHSFEVIGCGAVYVIDAHDSTENNISEARQSDALSIFNLRFHVLTRGDAYDLRTQRPKLGPDIH